MVTLNVQVLVFPAASAAVTVTVFVPIGKAEPEGGSASRLSKVQLSVADTLKSTRTGQWPTATTVILVEQVTTGGVVSTRIGTSFEAEALQPEVLLTARWRVTLPEAPAV